MTWDLYKSRNDWLASNACGEARSLDDAKASAESTGATHLSNGLKTYYRFPLSQAWRKA